MAIVYWLWNWCREITVAQSSAFQRMLMLTELSANWCGCYGDTGSWTQRAARNNWAVTTTRPRPPDSSSPACRPAPQGCPGLRSVSLMVIIVISVNHSSSSFCSFLTRMRWRKDLLVFVWNFGMLRIRFVQYSVHWIRELWSANIFTRFGSWWLSDVALYQASKWINKYPIGGTLEGGSHCRLS